MRIREENSGLREVSTHHPLSWSILSNYLRQRLNFVLRCWLKAAMSLVCVKLAIVSCFISNVGWRRGCCFYSVLTESKRQKWCIVGRAAKSLFLIYTVAPDASLSVLLGFVAKLWFCLATLTARESHSSHFLYRAARHCCPTVSMATDTNRTQQTASVLPVWPSLFSLQQRCSVSQENPSQGHWQWGSWQKHAEDF